MLKGLKINTALLICVAFLFRLLSSSLSLISTNTDGNTLQSSSSISLNKQGVSSFEKEKNSHSFFTDLLISEEGADDENEHKCINPVLTEPFFGALVVYTESPQQAITPTNKHYTCNSSKRHLEFGVFRI